jgi:hypothetical protein
MGKNRYGSFDGLDSLDEKDVVIDGLDSSLDLPVVDSSDESLDLPEDCEVKKSGKSGKCKKSCDAELAEEPCDAGFNGVHPSQDERIMS